MTVGRATTQRGRAEEWSPGGLLWVTAYVGFLVHRLRRLRKLIIGIGLWVWVIGLLKRIGLLSCRRRRRPRLAHAHAPTTMTVIAALMLRCNTLARRRPPAS